MSIIHSSKIFVVSACVSLLIGACSSTTSSTPPKRNSLEETKFKDVKLLGNHQSFKSAFNELATATGLTINTVSNKHGSAEWFSYDSSSKDYILRSAILYDIYPQLQRACKTQFSIVGSLASAYVEGLFDPLKYGLSEKDKQFLLNLNTYGYNTYLRHNNPDAKDFRANVDNYFIVDGHLNSIGGYGTDIMVDADRYYYPDLTFICSEGGIIKEAITIGDDSGRNSISLKKKARFSGISEKLQSSHYAVYMGEDVIDSYVRNNLELAMEHAEKVRLPKDKEEKARLARIKEKEQQKTKEYENHKRASKEKWDSRITNKYAVGDKVCSRNNKMGFIEQAAGNNNKILWKGIVSNKINGYFFGSLDLEEYKKDKFYYTPINDITWESKENIAPCDFSL